MRLILLLNKIADGFLRFLLCFGNQGCLMQRSSILLAIKKIRLPSALYPYKSRHSSPLNVQFSRNLQPLLMLI